MFKPSRTLCLLGLLAATPAAAQLLGGGQPIGGIGQTVGGIGRTAGNTVGTVDRSAGNMIGGATGSGLTDAMAQQLTAPGSALNSVLAPVGRVITNAEILLQLRRMRHDQLIGQHPSELEAGENGVPVRRGRLLLVDPSQAQLQAAGSAGFPIMATQRDASLGMTLVIVATPSGMPVRKAQKKLEAAVPGIAVDADAVMEPAGGAIAPLPGMAMAASAGTAGGARRIAMVDGGVAAHPALARASIEQKGFAGRAAATGHGTAVASLLVGEQGQFRGAARGSSLFVADIYGGNPAAGSVSSVVQALGWAASKRPQVVTMSLVGPPNAALARAVGALQRLGIKVVAAVGNDGPAAPAAYPASYDGVLSVTGVDAKGKALPEAGRPKHLDYAAPGSAMAAALPGSGYADVRGTSFAAPLAAARVLATGTTNLRAEALPGKGRVGAGIVCSSCRIAPSVVGAK